MSEENKEQSFLERRLSKDPLARSRAFHPAIRMKARENRSAELEELRNGINDEPLPENVIPISKPGIETNGYKK